MVGQDLGGKHRSRLVAHAGVPLLLARAVLEVSPNGFGVLKKDESEFIRSAPDFLTGILGVRVVDEDVYVIDIIVRAGTDADRVRPHFNRTMGRRHTHVN
ncbi:hypothetical protein D9M72_572680 [compost metagenome]